VADANSGGGGARPAALGEGAGPPSERGHELLADDPQGLLRRAYTLPGNIASRHPRSVHDGEGPVGVVVSGRTEKNALDGQHLGHRVGATFFRFD